MGGHGMKLRLSLRCPGFSGLAILLELVESTGIWPQGLFGCLYCHDF